MPDLFRPGPSVLRAKEFLMCTGPSLLDFLPAFPYHICSNLPFPPFLLLVEASVKKWLIAPVVLVVLLAGAAAALFFALNSIVEKGVNTIGPELTGTAVHLEKADISLFSGTGMFTGFTVGNPEGFSVGHAVSIGSLSVAVDTSTVLKETIVIPKIEIDHPAILYELNKETSNIETILKHVQSIADKEKGNEGQQAGTSSETPEKSKKKVIIDELVIRDAQATLLIPMLKLSVSIPLPEIRLTGIGREGSGVTIAQSAVLILKEMKASLEASTVKLRETQLKDAKNALLRQGKDTEEKAKGLLKEGLNLFKK